MASLTTLAAVQPAAINGLEGSSLTGTKLVVKPTRQSIRTKNIRSGAVVAKYGDKNVYFDLEDLGNTTGKWDLNSEVKRVACESNPMMGDPLGSSQGDKAMTIYKIRGTPENQPFKLHHAWDVLKDCPRWGTDADQQWERLFQR
ncbi:photosystem I reaction center subunit VI-2 [Pyrus ussuriensis x Pyrus communis]|uniref:Photosystem I reaction center subunit VI n=1 Tax=Pyrus ussuriensis x Pyrus communis TaxID=2448454 RepID=A0A5N5FSC3_9ROSA|nr:photosystem I reaction center subunit VI-2 [Pyrus ussuriensis x Pyrus communis]